MNLYIQAIGNKAKFPLRATDGSAGYDLFMPCDGKVSPDDSEGVWVDLGICMAIPDGFVGLLLPRSGKGAKNGLALNNTVGVIDSDYRGELRACLRVHNDQPLSWKTDDSLLQIIFVRSEVFTVVCCNKLPTTQRGSGGFGSTSA